MRNNCAESGRRACAIFFPVSHESLCENKRRRNRSDEEEAENEGKMKERRKENKKRDEGCQEVAS